MKVCLVWQVPIMRKMIETFRLLPSLSVAPYWNLTPCNWDFPLKAHSFFGNSNIYLPEKNIAGRCKLPRSLNSLRYVTTFLCFYNLLLRVVSLVALQSNTLFSPLFQGKLNIFYRKNQFLVKII
jgi:hypothetical protein